MDCRRAFGRAEDDKEGTHKGPGAFAETIVEEGAQADIGGINKLCRNTIGLAVRDGGFEVTMRAADHSAGIGITEEDSAADDKADIDGNKRQKAGFFIQRLFHKKAIPKVRGPMLL